MKRSRDERAVKRKSTFGRTGRRRRVGGLGVGRAQAALVARAAGPLPVQIDGTEILMEWITDDGETAPRLAQTRPDRPLLESYFEQLRDALATMVQHGVVHGDLSAYNILAAGDRLVIIDLPQIVDLVGNLQRDGLPAARLRQRVRVVPRRGLEVDEHDLFGELMAHAF